MKKLYRRLAVIFVISTLLTAALFVASLFDRSKKENYHYLAQLLSGVEANFQTIRQDYEERLEILEDDYLNRAWAVEYIIAGDSRMITEQELEVVRKLMEVQGISVTDREGKLCLSVGEKSLVKGDTVSAETEREAVVTEAVGFYEKPSFFYVEVWSESPYFASVRLDARTDRLGLKSRKEMIEETLRQATTEEDTMLAAVEKETGQLVGISRNNEQKVEIDGLETSDQLLDYLKGAEKGKLLIRKLNGEYHTVLIQEQEDIYFLASTRLSGIMENMAKTMAEGLAGIAAVSFLTLLVLHFHLKKYLFGQVSRLRGEMQKILEGKSCVARDLETAEQIPELAPLAETIRRLGQDYREKREGISRMRDQLSLARTEARFDQLTGLYNRNGFEHCMEEFLNRVHPEGLLVLFDLDNFKRINDSEGHPEGDRLLVRFAECLRENFRKSDLIGRLGGDEFTVLIPNAMPRDLLELKFRTLLENVRTALGEYYQKYQVSVSIGAVPVDGEMKSYDSLYRCADTALYIAKYLGKDQYYINDGKISCMKRECIGCRQNCPRSRILKQRQKKEKR